MPGFENSTRIIELMKHYDKGETIYTYMGQFRIGLNTKNRIVIRPPKSLEKKSFQFINYNFGNFEQSTFGVSFGFGVSKFLTDKLSDKERVNLYVFGNWYFCPPRLPVNNIDYALSLGTNIIDKKLFNHIILGIRLGWFNPAGIIIGVNWASIPDDGRRLHLLFGLDYKL